MWITGLSNHSPVGIIGIGHRQTSFLKGFVASGEEKNTEEGGNSLFIKLPMPIFYSTLHDVFQVKIDVFFV